MAVKAICGKWQKSNAERTTHEKDCPNCKKEISKHEKGDDTDHENDLGKVVQQLQTLVQSLQSMLQTQQKRIEELEQKQTESKTVQKQWQPQTLPTTEQKQQTFTREITISGFQKLNQGHDKLIETVQQTLENNLGYHNLPSDSIQQIIQKPKTNSIVLQFKEGREGLKDHLLEATKSHFREKKENITYDDSNIYFNPTVTRETGQLHYEARKNKLPEVMFVWINLKSHQLFVRKDKESNAVLIKNMEDLKPFLKKD
eukprot:Lithocolla_globosa_v1_NODE_1222_length_2763_cov_217.716765.p2 type:complete len:257 gc:universal NODE_1222_length_2763_cov_217.716765:2576-1806(-)